jgi:tRNA A37 methylthiotransferase MiaB
VSRLVEELTDQRAADRIGEVVEVLLEDEGETGPIGRAAHQGPESDGVTEVTGLDSARTGALVSARVVDNTGVDLHAVATGSVR